MYRVDLRMTDDPLMCDRIVVTERDRDGHASRHLHG